MSRILHPLSGFAQAVQDYYREPETSPVQASLDDVTRQIARMLFRADAILTGIRGDFDEAEYPVQTYYLARARQSVALASDEIRRDAMSQTIAAVPGRVEAEQKDGFLLDGDLRLCELAADITTGEYLARLDDAYRQARGRR